MKSFRAGAFTVLGILCAGLSACTDSSITAVKEASLPRSDFTFGEALDSPKGCKSTKWERTDDANGRPLVTYTCTAEAFDDVTQQARKEGLAELAVVSQEKSEMYPKMIAELQKNLDNAKASAERDVFDQSQKLQEAEKAVQDLRTQLDEMMKSPTHSLSSKQMTQGQLMQSQLRLEELKAQTEKAAPTVKLQAEGLVAKAQTQLDDAVSWQERFASAVKTTRDSVGKEIDEHYDRSHSFKLRMQFAVSSKSPITPTTIEWLMDDRSAAASFLMPSFLYNPKQMESSLRGLYAEQVTLKVRGRYQELFPIQCYYRWSDPTIGCAVKEK